MMKTNNFNIKSADGKTDLHVIRWVPEKDIKGILQITHGMLEYIDRYDEFASYLCQNNYLVVGQDILGHGDSVTEKSKRGFFAQKNGNKILLEDMYKVMEETKEDYPDLPYFHLGHSMGSYLLRQFITIHSEDISGAILVGTGFPPKIVLHFGIFLTNLFRKLKGDTYRSKLIDNISIGRFNSHYENPNTNVDWISRDEEIVREYVNDEKIDFIFTVNAYYNMYKSIRFLHDTDHLKKIREDLPIILMSGQEDPIGDFGKAVEATYRILKKIGIENVDIKLYPEARHEIINEINRSEVYEDILNWLDRKVEINE
ncbi:MAG: alpha/beta fold hydrolase [Clostridia bacterium]